MDFTVKSRVYTLQTQSDIKCEVALSHYCQMMTGQYYVTPECRMTSTMITSSRVENISSEVKERHHLFNDGTAMIGVHTSYNIAATIAMC